MGDQKNRSLKGDKKICPYRGGGKKSQCVLEFPPSKCPVL
jgi:hypothetical protein